MKKNILRKAVYILVGLLIIPTIAPIMEGIYQRQYIQTNYGIEGFIPIEIINDKSGLWVRYKSKTDEVYKLRSVPYIPYYGNATTDTGTIDLDTNITSGTGSDHPYCTSNYLFIQHTPAVLVHHTLLKGTLPSGSGTITSVKVYMYCFNSDITDSDGRNLYIRETGPWDHTPCPTLDDWNSYPELESTITHYAIGNLNFNTDIYHSYELEDSVTNYGLISDLGYSWGDEFYIIFYTAWNTDADFLLSYWSLNYDNGSKAPYIEVTYT